MIDWGQTFWVSFSASLLAIVVVACIRYLTKPMFFGWPSSWLYAFSLTSIQGTWDANFYRQDRNELEVVVVNVQQFLIWVWGTISHPEKNRKYTFHGTIGGRGILDATYEGEWDTSIVDRGKFTLFLLVQAGEVNRMEGQCSWTDGGNQEVSSGDCVWRKRNGGSENGDTGQG